MKENVPPRERAAAVEKGIEKDAVGEAEIEGECKDTALLPGHNAEALREAARTMTNGELLEAASKLVGQLVNSMPAQISPEELRTPRDLLMVAAGVRPAKELSKELDILPDDAVLKRERLSMIVAEFR